MNRQLPTYPWQNAQWELIRSQLRADRLGHALLLAGPAGLGKTEFAHALAQALLCATPDDNGACGDCRGCRLVAAGSHPDMRVIGLDADSRVVKVDAVRGLTEFVHLKSQYGGRRLGLIQTADQMNINAANSLLKILEEPPEGTVLILVADRPTRLPATVRSRCQRIEFLVPATDQAISWLVRERGMDEERAGRLLALAAGAPCRVAALEEAGVDALQEKLLAQLASIRRREASPVDMAAEWEKSRHGLLHELFTITVEGMIRHRGGVSSGAGGVTQLEELSAGLDIIGLHRLLDDLYSLAALSDRPLQPQLFAEDLFLRWRQTCEAVPQGPRRAVGN